MRRGLSVAVLALVALGMCFAVSASAAKKPNLKVTALDEPPAEGTPDSGFDTSETTSNRGRKTAKPSITRFYLSSDAIEDNQDVRLFTKHQVPKLRKQKSDSFNGPLSVPDEMELGSYYLIACADETEVVTEKREGDNCKASSGQIDVVAPDGDADGVPDDQDNCTEFANPNQSDTDADDKGDACDACPNDPNPGPQACPTTVYLINSGTTPSGSTVRLSNVIVQGVDTSGTPHTWVAEPQSSPNFAGYANSGIEMARPDTPFPPSLGDNITVDGELSTVDGRPLLTPTAIQLNSSGNSPNQPHIVTTNAVAAATTDLHGVLVQVFNTEVQSVSAGDWTLNGDAIVDDEIFTLPATTVGQDYSTITGIARTGSAGTLAPRSAADIVPAP